MKETNQLTWWEMNILLEFIANSGEADRNADLRGIFQKIQRQRSLEVTKCDKCAKPAKLFTSRSSACSEEHAPAWVAKVRA